MREISAELIPGYFLIVLKILKIKKD